MKKIFLTLSILLISNAFAYDFEFQGRTITYNPDTLKFYENSVVLPINEIKEIFPEYEIILISKFDKERKFYVKNSLFKSKKVLILNNDTRTFHGFEAFPISSRDEFQSFKQGEIKSLMTIYGKKNIRLKHSGGDEFEVVVR